LSKTFVELGVEPVVVNVLLDRGIEEAFPIQEMTIADALAGRDVCGKAKTGSGKTLAFGIPTVQLLADREKTQVGAIILVPTRELATQVFNELDPLAEVLGIRAVAVYGGADIDRQISIVKKGVELIVATPGRMIDLMDRGVIDVHGVRLVVIDEAPGSRTR
jgi:superfamily II DNA/RNA helicase